MVAQVLRTTLSSDPFFALVEHDHTVGHGVDTWQLVRDDDKGHAESFPKAKDEGIELGRSYRIEARGRLVKKEHRRVEGHGARNGGALLHATADLGGQVAAKTLQSDQLQFIHEMTLRASTGRRVNSSRGKLMFSFNVIDPKSAPLW